MLTLNLKTRFRNKTFILSMVGAIVLLIQNLGYKDLIPYNYADTVNTILTILTMLGIVVDPSSNGLSDGVAANEQEVKEDSTEAEETTGAQIDINTIIAENEALKAQLEQIKSTFAIAQ